MQPFIKKNRFVIEPAKDSYDEQSSFDNSGPVPAKRPLSRTRILQISLASGIFLVSIIILVIVILYYKKPDLVSQIAKNGKKADTVEQEISAEDSLIISNEHLKRGIDLYNRGQLNAAITELFEVVESSSPDAEKAVALRYLGMIEHSLDNYTKAISHYNRAMKYAPKDYLTLLHLSKSYRKLNRNEEAIETIDRAIEIKPDADELYVEKGNILYSQTQYLKARDAYAKAVEIHSENPTALYNYALSLIQTGDTMKAVETLKQAASADRAGSITYQSYSRLGALLLENKQYEEAIKYLKFAINISPSTADYYNTALALLSLGRKEEALPYLEKAEQTGSEDAASLEKLADMYSQYNNNSKSIELYRKVITVQQNNIPVLFKLGDIYYKNKDLNEAIVYFRRITEIEPASENARLAWINMGNIYDDSLRYQDAVEAYKNAIAINPSDDIAYYNLGITFHHMGDRIGAVDSYRKAASLNPDNPKPLIAVADLLYSSGYMDEALQEYSKITERWPAHADAYFSLATIYNKKGLDTYAQQNYKKVIDIGTSKDLTRKSYINLAIIAAKTESPDSEVSDAASYVQKALLLKPGDTEALYALGVIYYNRMMYDKSIETFYQIVKASSDEIEIAKAYNNIGKSHFQKKEYRQALRAFSLGLEQDPTNEELRLNRRAASAKYEEDLSGR